MAAILVPVLVVGAAETSKNPAIRTYAEREVFGLEPPASSRSDLAGANEQLRYLRSVSDWALVEHDANGVHATLQIPRALLLAAWDGSSYTVDPDSYSMGTRQADAAVWTITRVGAGELTIDLGASYALPSAATYGVHDVSPSEVDQATGAQMFVKAQLRTRTSATKFGIRRWSGTTRAAMAMADGPFAIAVVGE